MLGSDLGALANLLATIRQQYPQAHVTDGLRDPNSPLGRANPHSSHLAGTPEDPGAVDVRPIPRVSFDQYVNSIKGAGVPITQAFDEQKHPFPWTTGPNWHLAQGQSVAQPIRKPRTLGDVMPKPDLGGMAPVDAAQSPMTLGQINNPIAQPSLPDAPGHKGLFPGKDWKSILGILGDALTAYGGGQPIFGPAMLKRHAEEQQQGFDREKLAAMIQMKREAAMQPKPPTQTDRYLQEILDPRTPEPRRALLRSYMLQPRMVAMTGSDGSQTTNAYYPDQQGGGEDDWEYSN